MDSNEFQELVYTGFPPGVQQWLRMFTGQALTGYHGTSLLLLQGPGVRNSPFVSIYRELFCDSHSDSSYGLAITQADLLPENRRELFRKLRGKRQLFIDFDDDSFVDYVPTLTALLQDQLDVGVGEWIPNGVNVFLYSDKLPSLRDIGEAGPSGKEFLDSVAILNYWPSGWNQEAENYFKKLHSGDDNPKPSRDRSKSGKARRNARKTTRKSASPGVAGVYAYSYPTHISARDEEGRFLVKIGRGADMASRVAHQARRTEVPEDLSLLRTYPTNDPVGLERTIHQHFKQKDQHHKTTHGGTEWFRVSLAELDDLVSTQGVKPDFASDS